MTTHIKTLIHQRKFLPLFITQFLGAFNDNVFRTALVTVITYHTANFNINHNPALISLAMGLFVLPFFIFSASAGQLADKFEKGNLIRIIKFFEILVMTLGLLAFSLHQVVFLLIVLFLMGTQSAFFGPVKYSILPDHLTAHELIAGNGLIEAGTFLAILLGTLTGGLFIAEGHASLNILSFFTISIAILGFIASLWILPTAPAEPTLPLQKNVWRVTIRAMRFAHADKTIFLAILGISWFWLIGATFLAQLPSFTKTVLQADPAVFTLLLTVFSLGIGVGSILCNTLLKGEINSKFVPVSALLMTVFMLDIACSSQTFALSSGLLSVSLFFKTLKGWRIASDLFLLSLLGGLYIVPLYALMQARSNQQQRSRIIAANNIINALFMVIASGAAMILLNVGWSIPQLFMLIASINLLVALYICKLVPESVIQALLKSILKVCFRVKVKGLENFEHCRARTLIIANHTSLLDGVLLAVFLPGKVTFAINTFAAENSMFKPLIALTETFTIDPTNPMSTKSLIKEMKQNKKIVIFPEGRLTVTGSLMKIYPGPGMIADKADADILPIYIEGAKYSLFSRLKSKYRLRKFPKITLHILAPTQLNIPTTIKGKQRREKAGEQLYDIMSTMMFDKQMMAETLFTSLVTAKKLHGGKRNIVDDARREPLTYHQLILRSLLLGKQIRNTCANESFVGLLMPNLTSSVVCFFALQAIAKAPAMLNFTAGTHTILATCHTANIKHIYSIQAFIKANKLEGLIAQLEQQDICIHYLEDLANSINRLDKGLAWFNAKFPLLYYRLLNRHSPTALESESPAVVLFTSGSEGTPKGVVLSHRNLQANLAQVASRVDFNPSDIIFNALPMFHTFGLSQGTLLPILSGIQTFLYLSPLHYRMVPELVYDINATMMFGTDTFLANYAKYAHHYDFYSIRYVFAGAEKLHASTQQLWLEKFGVRIFEGYGVTETAPVISTNTPMHNKPGTVGQLLPGISHRLEHIPGIENGGRLWVKGPNVMLGYLLHEQPGRIVAVKNGWYDTGDIATMDEQRYLRILGRAKRFAKIAGEMVSLTAIENYLYRLWPNEHHAVIAQPDPKKGEQLLLVTTCKKAELKAILKFASSNGITELQVPKQIEIVDELPVLGSGKTDYVTLHKQRLR